MIAGKRIDYLDGLRGVAIIAVVLFHAYVNYPDKLPFGERFGVLPLRLGWQGVQLFFLISGFVILMTLERCNNLVEFAWRRWLRLFPAMLIASIMTFAIEGDRPWADLFPGLMFISPSLIHSVTGLQLHSMDGVYWSLYVEVIFYAIFGGAYFMFGKQIAIAFVFALFAASLMATSVSAALPDTSLASRAAAASRWIGFIHFGWFASGALFYLYAQARTPAILAGASIAGVISALSASYAFTETLGLVFVVGIFFVASISISARKALSNRVARLLGFVSYPLYLVHEPLIAWMQPIFVIPMVHPIMWPVLPLIGTIGIAWLISRFGEPITKEIILRGPKFCALTN